MQLFTDIKNVLSTNPFIAAKRIKRIISLASSMHKNVTTQNPIRLQVEITDRCNINCIMCDRLRRSNIDYKLSNDLCVESINRLIKEIDPFYLTLNGYGEPLLHSHFEKIIFSATSNRITTTMPTNLQHEKSLLDKLIRNSPKKLVVSLHFATRDCYKKICKKDGFEKFFSNLHYLSRKLNRKKTKLIYVCAVQKNNLMEYQNFVENDFLLNKINNINVIPATHSVDDPNKFDIIPGQEEVTHAIENIEKDISKTRNKNIRTFMGKWQSALICLRDQSLPNTNSSPCLVPWFSSYIAANGDVFPCCYLTNSKHILGNIYENHFEHIWLGDRYEHFRNKLIHDRKSLNGCRTCPRDDSQRLNIIKHLQKMF